MRSIVFTVHQRPFYFRDVLAAWREVRGVQDWEVVFHIDPSSSTAAQADLAEEFASWHGSTRVCIHDHLYGVLGNPFHALTEAFEDGADYTVLAEEDVEVSTDVLEYFTFAQSQPDLLAACAWSDHEDGDLEMAHRRYWFNPWAWGLTTDMWEAVVAPTWDHDYSTGDVRGPGGWDCNLGLRVVHDYDCPVMFPEVSRSRTIGQFLGVHSAAAGLREDGEPTLLRPRARPGDVGTALRLRMLRFGIADPQIWA